MTDYLRDYFYREQAEKERLERVGSAEKAHLERVKVSAEALSCDQSIFVVNRCDYTPQKIIPLWDAVCLSAGVNPKHKDITGEKWIRELAPYSTGETGTTLNMLLEQYDYALHYARIGDLKTFGESHQIPLQDFKKWESLVSPKLPGGFLDTPESLTSADPTQVMPAEAEDEEAPSSESGKAQIAPGNWKMKIQAEATSRFKRLRASGASPSVHSILDEMVNWCRDNDVKTSGGIYPSAGYLRTHVLGGQHWTSPH